MKKNINTYIVDEKRLMDEEYRIICEIVKLRKEKGLSQRQLCALVGINQPSLVRIEKGKHTPGLNTLIKILSAMDCKIEFVKNKTF